MFWRTFSSSARRIIYRHYEIFLLIVCDLSFHNEFIIYGYGEQMLDLSVYRCAFSILYCFILNFSPCEDPGDEYSEQKFYEKLIITHILMPY